MRATVLIAALLVLPLAHAADGSAADQLLPRYRQECSACHVAYPPRMLPAASWQRLLAHLPYHFGTDASLDAPTIMELSAWLTAHAARSGRAPDAPPQDRITRSTWFVHEHGKLPSAVWKRPAIRSAANCAACHSGAEQGVFDEDDVRIPR